jgi:hypothetical protein
VDDVAALVHGKPRGDHDSDGDLPAQPVKTNQLPDVYPDDNRPGQR